MKKHSVNKQLPVPSIHSIIATQKLHGVERRTRKTPPVTTTSTVPPPDEETLLMLNKIAKESPFCFYFKGKSNDLL